MTGGGSGTGPSPGAGLFVRPQEPGDFGAQQLDEGARKHLFGLLRRVLEVVLGVSEDIKQGFYQLLVLEKSQKVKRSHALLTGSMGAVTLRLPNLQDLLVVLRGVQPAVPHYVLYQLLVVLWRTGKTHIMRAAGHRRTRKQLGAETR